MTATESRLTTAAREIADHTPDVDTHAAPHVIEALRRVMRDLPAIGKDQTASAQQGGYAYRGIEQITQHAQPLFARHGVVFVPKVLAHEIRDLTVNNKPWTDTILSVAYDVYGPGGPEDRIMVGPILAIGRDNSDKGANKAMTQAFKYALLQAFAISDAKDDADGQTHEADTAPAPVPEYLHQLIAATEGLTEGQRGLLRDWLKEQGLPDRPSKMNASQAERVCDYIANGLPKEPPKADDAGANQEPDTEGDG